MSIAPKPQHVLFAEQNVQTLDYPIDILFPSEKLSTEEVRARLKPAQLELIQMYAGHPATYFSLNRPRFDAIAAYLGIQCVEAMGGAWLFEGTAQDMYDKIHDMGTGVYMHARYITQRQSKFDPMYTVIGMEMTCDQHKLNSIKCPGADGTDLLYSRDPIPNPVFDNGKYIPAMRGYYSVIGTGGAR